MSRYPFTAAPPQLLGRAIELGALGADTFPTLTELPA
jgi:hypothetical protein